MSEDNCLIFSGDAKIEYFYEYFLTTTGEAVEAKRKETQEKYGIGQYYFMGFSFDGEKKGLSYDDLKAAVFGADRSALIADVERLRAELLEARRALGKAAMEINVAGPVDHRIRVMRKELSEENDRLRKIIGWLEKAHGIRYQCANCQANILDGVSVSIGVDDAGLEIIFCEKCNGRPERR